MSTRVITLNEIALAARLSPRGLQAAFSRHLDTTPLAYLHSVRMERAHRDLRSADPDDDMSVATSVARLRIDPSWRFRHCLPATIRHISERDVAQLSVGYRYLPQNVHHDRLREGRKARALGHW
jgi:AraC-like DNA-binding protein